MEWLSSKFSARTFLLVDTTRIAHLLLLLLVVSTSLLFLNSPGTDDVKVWLDYSWVPNYRQYGLIQGYAQTADDYPPLSFAVIAAIAEVSARAGVPLLLIFKVFIFLFLVLTTLVFWYYTRNIFFASLLHLSLTLTSVALGYLDIMFAALIVLSLFALRDGRHVLASVSFTAAALIKYLPLAILPFLILYLTKAESTPPGKGTPSSLRKRIFKVTVPALIVSFATLLLFGPRSVFLSVLRIPWLQSQISGDALNFGHILGYAIMLTEPGRYDAVWQINAGDYWITLIPRAVFALLYIAALWRFFRVKRKSFSQMLLYCGLGYLAYFMFNTGINENYLLLPTILLVMLAHENRLYIADCAFWSVYQNVNLLAFYGVTGKGLGLETATFDSGLYVGFVTQSYMGFVTVLISFVGVAMYLRFYFRSVVR